MLVSFATLLLGLSILIWLDNQTFIRGYIGDLIIVIFLYSLLGFFTRLQPRIIAIIVLTFSFVIEFLQLVKIIDILGIHPTLITSVILGSTFDIFDLLMYLIGVTTIFLIDRKSNLKK